MRVQVVRRALIAAAVAVAVLAPQAVGVAPASSTSSAQIERVSYTLWPTFRGHWWGYTITWNREQTQLIAAGLIPVGAAFGGIAGNVPGSLIGAGLGGFFGEAANQAVAHGNCLEYVMTYSGGSWLWRAHC